MTTVNQVKQGVALFQRAAKVLYDANYPGQAIARAHHALSTVCEFIARHKRDSILWPKERDGVPARRYNHTHVPVTVEAIRAERSARGETTSPLMTAEQAYGEAKRLLAGRMDGDYKPHLPVNKQVAEQLMLSSHTLCKALIAEAERVDRLERG